MDFLELARKYQDQMVKDLIDLIAIPSLKDESTVTKEQPFGFRCKEALDFMLNKAKADGFKVENVDGYAGVIQLGDNQKNFGLLGHLDVVPVDASEWDSDPFKAIVRDGIIVGRGANDDKGPTIAAYYALKMIKDLGLKMHTNAQLICGVDEESGMECMKHFAKVHQLPDFGIVPDACFPVVFGEKGIINLTFKGPKVEGFSLNCGKRPNVVIGHSHAVVCQPLEATRFNDYLKYNNLIGNCYQDEEGSHYILEGKNCHGSTPQKGISAGLHMLAFVGVAHNYPQLISLVNLLRDCFGSTLGIGHDGSHMSALTMNVGILDFNQNDSKVVLDIRYPNDLEGSDVINKVESALGSLNYELIEKSDSKPLFVDPNSDWIQTCLRVYREISQDYNTPPLTMGGGTYARTLPNHVAYGAQFPKDVCPEWVGGPHEKNEGFPIESLVKASAIYAKLISELCCYEDA